MLGDVNVDAITPFVIVPAVLGAGIFSVVILLSKRACRNLETLGAKLGFHVHTTGRFFKKARLTGQLRGRRAEIFSYTTGSGKYQQNWVAAEIKIKSAGRLRFSLKPRMVVFDFVARFFRKNETGVGDVTFDKKWVLTTNQPDFMRAALLPEMREKIQRMGKGRASTGHYKLVSDKVSYAEQGSFSSVKVCARIEEVVEVVCDLADAVQVGAELRQR